MPVSPAPLRELSEQQLLARLRTGDGEALRVIFDQYAADLHRLAHRLLGSSDDADDVVQDVFVGLPTALARYTERGTLGPWLRRITARLALMRLRGDRRRDATDLRSAPSGPHAPEPDVLLKDRLTRAIAGLSPPLRVVFVLRMIEKCSHEEIASLLGTSVSASKVRLHRALQQLRPLLVHLRDTNDL
jgi:RNA polymerase sigma-70 factor (ECF subfamily)